MARDPFEGVEKVKEKFAAQYERDAQVVFECELVFAALRPGGLVILDDIDGNRGFVQFTARHPEADWVVAIADDEQRLFGLAQKRPAVDLVELR